MIEFQMPNNVIELVEALKHKGIPESEYRRYILKFLEGKARWKRVPVHGTFELTPLCNLDCKMCYVHLKSNQFAEQELLSASIWKSLMEQAHEAGMLTASLTGGECLTYPDFDELYLFLKNMGVSVTIMTNGVLVDERRIAFFKKYKPRGIQITLYGGSNDEYEKVTGHRVFEKVLHNLLLLRDAGLRISISITPSQFMQVDVKAFLEKVESLKIPYAINSSLIVPRENTGRDRYDMSIDQYFMINRARRDVNGDNPIPIDPCDLPMENRNAENGLIYGLRCGAARSGFAILYDGSMSPCVGLSEVKSQPLKDGFFEAWKQLVSKADNYLMPAECEDCVYRNECLTCPAVHKEAPTGHCDTRICEHTKKFVAGGLMPVPVKLPSK